jgi:hypothetical protein
VFKSLFLGYTDPADRSSTFLGNVGSHLRIDKTSHPTRLESPSTTLPEPHTLQKQNIMVAIAQPVSLLIPRSLLRVHKKSHHQENNPVFITCLGIQVKYIPYNTKPTVLQTYLSMGCGENGKVQPHNPDFPLNRRVSALGCMLQLIH